MSIISFDAHNALVLNNGIAYGVIAGGATSYIAEELKWYTGNTPTAYLGMLVSRGLSYPRIVSLLAVRAAIISAAADHPIELSAIVGLPAAGGHPLAPGGHAPAHALVISAAERLSNDDLIPLTVYARLPPAAWNADYAVAFAANANAVAPVAPYAINRVPDEVRAALTSPEMKLWAQSTARMAYTILANNGLGLITASHHFRGQAINSALSTMKMYTMDRQARDIGEIPKDIAGFLYHDTLHPLSYERVVEWANALPDAAAAKIASTVHKRLPAFPGGVVFIQRAWTCRNQISGHTSFTPVFAKLRKLAADTRLENLHRHITGHVLDYNAVFRPAAYAAHAAEIQSVVTYAVALFGIYDTLFGTVGSDDGDGPTKGPGILKLIGENRAAYQAAVDATRRSLVGAAAAAPEAIFAELGA